jgi:hypothetical protein
MPLLMDYRHHFCPARRTSDGRMPAAVEPRRQELPVADACAGSRSCATPAPGSVLHLSTHKAVRECYACVTANAPTTSSHAGDHACPHNRASTCLHLPIGGGRGAHGIARTATCAVSTHAGDYEVLRLDVWLLLTRTPHTRGHACPHNRASTCLHLPTGGGRGAVFTYDRDYEVPRLDVWASAASHSPGARGHACPHSRSICLPASTHRQRPWHRLHIR